HAMKGTSLAPVTARLVAELVAGETPSHISNRSVPSDSCRCFGLAHDEGRGALEVIEHVFERLDVAELRVDVEEVPLDRPRDAVANAFADDDRPKAEPDRVLDRVPDAAGHRHAREDDRVDAGGA